MEIWNWLTTYYVVWLPTFILDPFLGHSWDLALNLNNWLENVINIEIAQISPFPFLCFYYSEHDRTIKEEWIQNMRSDTASKSYDTLNLSLWELVVSLYLDNI